MIVAGACSPVDRMSKPGVTTKPLLSNWGGRGGVILGLPQDWPSHPPTQADPPTHPPRPPPYSPSRGGVPQSGGGG